jgi:DNA-binding response OmpR family regulator
MPRIVMVDDDSDLRALARAFLEKQGWAFSGSPDGESGLEMIRGEKPDIVLLDVNLPDLDGFQVCSRLRGDPSLKSIPVVLISGDRRKAEDILQGLDATQADAYIVKPVHLPVLLAKLKAVLRASGHGQ